ncbi:MAG: TIGR03067 domain-containing protein [Gemmataceae bacterium]
MRALMSPGVVLLVGCAFGQPALPADDSMLMEGKWKVVALEADGRKAPPDDIKGMRWTVKSGELEMTNPGGQSKNKATISLDSGKSPKHIDLVAADGADKGKPVLGIYKLEKDSLVVCIRSPGAKKGRPKEFATTANSGLGLITLERVKE